MRSDIRDSIRELIRRPAITIAILATLGLGMGANWAVFYLIDALALRSLPVSDPDRLRIIQEVGGRGASDFVSCPVFRRLHSEMKTASGVMAASGVSRVPVRAEGGEETELTSIAYVSPSLFGILGATLSGRGLPEETAAAGALPGVVISHAYWQRRFGAESPALGRILIIGGRPFAVDGIAESRFSGVDVGINPDIWLALEARGEAWLADDDRKWVRVLIRLQPGVSDAQAEAEANVLFRRVHSGETRLRVAPGSSGFSQLRRRFLQPLSIAMAIAGLAMLICCFNVANLVLLRVRWRQKEICIRLAVGSGTGRLFRRVLVEALLLAAAGALAALCTAWISVRALLNLLPAQAGIYLPFRLDWRLALFAAGLCLVSVIICGCLPGFRILRADLGQLLKSDSPEAIGPAGRRGQGRSIVLLETTMAVCLAIVAGLFIRSLARLDGVDLGFRAENAISISVYMPKPYTPQQLGHFYEQLRGRLEALPGVSEAAFSRTGAFQNSTSSTTIRLPGGSRVNCNIMIVGPSFFQVVGARVMAGRDFAPTDSAGARPVAIVNRALSEIGFEGRNPVGTDLRLGEASSFITVVGLVNDLHHTGLRAAVAPLIYMPALQYRAGPDAEFFLRTSAPAASILAAVRKEIRTAAPDLQIRNSQTVVQQVRDSLSEERLLVVVSESFGILSLLLSSLGVFAVVASAVVSRTHEIGIRMALGASPLIVMGHVLRETALLVSAGTALGVPLALGAGSLVASLLFGVQPSDPFCVGGAVLIVALSAFAASLLPAIRAAHIPPTEALRLRV